MQPPIAIIPVRSEKQAMDWSLVLVSQGIDTAIEWDSENRIWGLSISELDHGRALGILRQYRRENRVEPWRQVVPGTELVFDWRAVFWFLLLGSVYVLDHATTGRLKLTGVMDNQAVLAGAWWRLFTATMLHGDLVHLATNATTGIVLLGLVMGVFGPGLGLLGAFLAGVCGNLAGLVFYAESHRGLGASGFVMGALGMLTGESLSLLKERFAPRHLILRALAGGFLLLILWGFSPNPRTDVLAHVAGFLSGALLGGAIGTLPARWLHHPQVDWLASALVGIVVILTWWMALSV